MIGAGAGVVVCAAEDGCEVDWVEVAEGIQESATGVSEAVSSAASKCTKCGGSSSGGGGNRSGSSGGGNNVDLDAFSAAGRVTSKNGVAAAGRAYQKHMGRNEFPNAAGKDLNRTGQELLDDILTSPGTQITTVKGGRAIGGTRFTRPDGVKAVFRKDGSFAYFGRSFNKLMALSVAEILLSFVGKQLASVNYHYVPFDPGSAYLGQSEGLDADLAAIDFDFADGSSSYVTWAISGDIQGLMAVEGSAYHGAVDAVFKATETQAWAPFVDEVVQSVEAQWQVSWEAAPETIWAFRLDFPSGSVVVALGTDDPQLDYMPDELVVVYDESKAKAFKPPHVEKSAWGT